MAKFIEKLRPIMTNQNALILIAKIEKSNYKPSDFERSFLLHLGSLCRTPQKVSVKQGKALEDIYRRSQGHNTKLYSRLIKPRRS